MEDKAFKLEIDIFVEGLPTFKTLSYFFRNLKLLRQGSERKHNQYWVMDERKYMLNEKGEYEPFVVFGKTAIRLSEMKAAIQRLELEEEEKNNFNALPVSKKIPKTWK